MAPADRIARLEEEKTAAEASAAAQKLALDALRAAGKEAEITTQMLADLARGDGSSPRGDTRNCQGSR